MNHQTSLFTGLMQPLLEGFAWGTGANEGSPPYSKEDLARYSATLLTTELVRDLADLPVQEAGIDLIEKVDAFVDTHKTLEPVREFILDLALLQVLDNGKENPDFLESKAWMDVEDKTEDRGTELLNILVYLRDCAENELTPDLDDFLFEFLLVDEDDHQDEFFIYESVISNREMVEGKVEEIVKLGNVQRDDMVELFTPLMVFFTRSEKRPGRMTLAMLEGSNLAGIHVGIYQLLSRAGEIYRRI